MSCRFGFWCFFDFEFVGVFLVFFYLCQMRSCVGVVAFVHWKVGFQGHQGRRYKFSARKAWLTVYRAMHVCLMPDLCGSRLVAGRKTCMAPGA